MLFRSEWDPPIPLLPPAIGPKPKISLKNVPIPTDWDFEVNALSTEEQERYKRAMWAQLPGMSKSAGKEEEGEGSG